MPLTNKIGQQWNPKPKVCASKINNEIENTKKESDNTKKSNDPTKPRYSGLRLSNKKEQYSEYSKIKEKLNGLKRYSTLMSALIKHPRLSSSPDSMSFATQRIFELQKNITDRAVQSIVQYQTASKKAEIGTAVSFFIAQIWKNSEKPEELTEDFIFNNFLKTYNDSEITPDIVFDNSIDKELDRKISEGNAINKMLPTLMDVERLGKSAELFWANMGIEGSVEYLKKDLISRAHKILRNVTQEENPDLDQHHIAYKSILNSLAWDYQPALEAEYIRIGRYFQGLTKDQRKEYMRDNILEEGILLRNVTNQMNSVESIIMSMYDSKVQNENKSDHTDTSFDQHNPS